MSGILLTTTQHFPQVIFEGIAGNSFTGDIAIDSVEINIGNCPGKSKSICILSVFLAIKPAHLRGNSLFLARWNP